MSSTPLIKLPQLGEPADREIALKIKALAEKSPYVVVTGHERPDGDCIGSELALALALNAAGIKTEICNSDPVPARYKFLASDRLFRELKPGEPLKAALVFVVDATDLSRLGELKPAQLGDAKIVNIDHHLENPNFGTINWVENRAAATGELVYRLLSACEWPLPLQGLQALYTALVTDTGQFSYSNTSPRALRIAAALVENGVDPEMLWQRIYLNKSWSELALESKARASLELFADGKICVISLLHQDFQSTGTGPQHTEDFAHIPRSIAGMEMALFFYELDEGRATKVSVRTNRHLNACALAKKFGGGGHRQAAGCTLPVPLAEAKKRFMPEALKALVPSPAHA